MKIGKRGKDLAVRIPAAAVLSLGLKLGDELEVVAIGPYYFDLKPKRHEAHEAVEPA